VLIKTNVKTSPNHFYRLLWNEFLLSQPHVIWGFLIIKYRSESIHYCLSLGTEKAHFLLAAALRELQKLLYTGIMRVQPKVSRLATWSENCKWYSSLPLGAVVLLFCESVF